MITRLFLGTIIAYSALSYVAARSPPIVAMQFGPAGNTLVVASQRGLRVLAWPNLDEVKEIKLDDVPNLHALTFSPSGSELAVAGGTPAFDGSVRILAWPSLEPRASLNRHSDTISDAAWLDDKTIVTAGLDQQIVIWNTGQREANQVLQGHSKGLTGLTITDDFIVSTGLDQSLKVWKREDGELARSLLQHTLPVHDLARRPTPSPLAMIASAGADRTIRFWQPKIGRMVRFARLSTKPLAIAWSEDGETVFAACVDGRIHAVDAATVHVKVSNSLIQGWAHCIAVHPTTGVIAVAGDGGQIASWNPASDARQ